MWIYQTLMEHPFLPFPEKAKSLFHVQLIHNHHNMKIDEMMQKDDWHAQCKFTNVAAVALSWCEASFVTDLSVMLTRKVGLGLQDLQKRGQRILAERNAKKAKENMWIGRMVAAKSIKELDGLIRSCAT